MSSRSMGNSSMRGRHSGGYSHEGFSSGPPNRHFYDQTSSFYSNPDPSYYPHHSQTPLHSNFHYQTNRSQVPLAGGSRTRFNSNRNYRTDPSHHNGKRLTSTTSSSSYEISTPTTSGE